MSETADGGGIRHIGIPPLFLRLRHTLTGYICETPTAPKSNPTIGKFTCNPHGYLNKTRLIATDENWSVREELFLPELRKKAKTINNTMITVGAMNYIQ